MGNILLLGEANSVWTKKCIEGPRLYEKHHIFLAFDENSQYEEYYISKSITCIPVVFKSFFINVPVIGMIGRIRHYDKCMKGIAKRYGSMDVAHINFVKMEKVYSVRTLKKYCKKIICTFWGSDLFRQDRLILLSYRRYFRYVDQIMLSTQEMKDCFQKIYGNEFDDKLISVRFGVDGFDYIVNTEKNRNTARRKFSVPEDKTVITIGYNGNESQQHSKVLDVIRELDGIDKERFFIQIPATYGLKAEYRSLLEDRLNKLGIEYQIIDTFLDDKDVGMLRLTSDIFIHAQITDASSASVQEYLYAGKTVFNPRWISYQDFKRKGIFYYEYKSFEDLKIQLKEYLNKKRHKEIENRLANNTKVIWELSSWRRVTEDWQRLYNG